MIMSSTNVAGPATDLIPRAHTMPPTPPSEQEVPMGFLTGCTFLLHFLPTYVSKGPKSLDIPQIRAAIQVST